MEESNQRFKMHFNVATGRKLNKATDGSQRYLRNDTVYAGSKTSVVGEILDENKSTGNDLEVWKSGG